MDLGLVYVKTPTGDEAVRQSTHVVQRNLRMVLVQVDGKLSVAEMAVKIGNVQLVEDALRKLEEGGFIAPSQNGVSVWEERDRQVRASQSPALSEFLNFAAKPSPDVETDCANRVIRSFFSFKKQTFLTSQRMADGVSMLHAYVEPEIHAPKEIRRYLLYKRVLFGLIGVFCFLLGLSFFYPYAKLVPGFEVSASRFLQTQVRIGHIGMAFSPWPQLILREIRLGERAESRIEMVRINSPFSLLSRGSQRISSIEVSGATITANLIAELPFFKVRDNFASSEIVIQEVRVKQSQVTVHELALRDLSGFIRFNSDGSLENSSFEAVDRSIQLTVAPAADGVALKIKGRGWKPFDNAISFDALEAEGLLQKDKLLIHGLDTTVLGGLIKGTWLFDWSKGLVIAGDGTLTRLDCRQVGQVFAPSLKLEGDLGGRLHLRASGGNWEGMWQSVEATLDAEITRGVFTGIDLGEAARNGEGSVSRAGSTKFDHLRTAVTIKRHQIRGRNLQLSAGRMGASGQFVASRGQMVEGYLTVGIQTSVSTLRIPVRISGTLPNLVVTGSK